VLSYNLLEALFCPSSDAFFDFLFVLLALFNIIGALLGIALARTILGRSEKR